MMVSEIDVYRATKLLTDQHGAEAPIHAAMHADAMLEKGDLDGQHELLGTRPVDGAAVH